ncbi:hypothetical protein FSP39_009948 [Pinctada imbricata]|uniref:Uncharacterized protein n=1 Tax=Pinctada imbricata TaxID=66713 RepID=A0AA89BSL2_PINIB|nr:hypothetical protein FSP39_009948 [Pinctada imbricata]
MSRKGRNWVKVHWLRGKLFGENFTKKVDPLRGKLSGENIIKMVNWLRGKPSGENRLTGSETGVTSAGASSVSHQDSLEQKVALLRERHILMQSAKSDMEIGLPPQIPISQDGEEGYVKSQKSIANYQSQDCQIFRPPPNKIVYDIDSPPPYISRSVSSIDSLGHASLGSRGRLDMDPNNSCDVMLRCYSMPNNNNHLNNTGGSRTPTSQHARHLRGKTNVQTPGLSLDRPPDYNQVVNIGVCSSSSSSDGKV